MRTIETRYIGPTETKAARIKAIESGTKQSLYVSYHDYGRIEDAYKDAARKLCAKFNWKGSLQGGHTKEGMVWTFIDQEYQITL